MNSLVSNNLTAMEQLNSSDYARNLVLRQLSRRLMKQSKKKVEAVLEAIHWKCHQRSQNVALKKQINEIYDEIRQKCSFFRYL